MRSSRRKRNRERPAGVRLTRMSTEPAPTDRSGRRARTAVPIIASFLWPGIGHAMLGRRALGALLALPQLALVAALAVGLLGSRAALIGWLLEPLVLLGLVGFNLVLLLSRACAIAGSAVIATDGRPTRATVTLVLLLVCGSMLVHGQATRMSWTAYETLTTVFSPSGPQGGALGGGPSATPRPTPVATADPTVAPTPSPSPTLPPPPDWAADGRLNLLLVGADAGPGRSKLRTDTMILLSVEIDTGKAALIGVPRNIRFAPMPPPLDAAFPGGFTDLLNALWVWVYDRPGAYPGEAAAAPYLAVQDAVGLLLGVDVDAMAVAELNGFVRAVDALGGLDIDVPSQVYDRNYPTPDGTGYVEVLIPAGPQHLDGWHALAYARTRHQDSDYQRMERQQLVLVAMQRQLRCGLAVRFTELLEIARDTLWTNFPLEGLPALVSVAGRVDPDRVARLTLTPPAFYPNLDAGGIEHIRTAVSDLLAAPLPAPDPSATPAPDPC